MQPSATSNTNPNAASLQHLDQPSVMTRFIWAATILVFFVAIFAMYFSTVRMLMANWQFGSYRHMLHGIFGF